MMAQRLHLLLALSVISMIAGCKPGGPSPSRVSGPKQIYVVNYPLKYFAERIVVDKAEVVFPAPDDVDPAYWKPDPEIIQQYQKADMIILNGATYAKWVPRATLPRSKMIITTRDFQDQLIHSKNAVVHSHGKTGKHSHKGIAFTTWLDPILAAQQAHVIYQALADRMPEERTKVEANYKELADDLHQLDKRLQSMIQGQEDKPLLASHPVYQYFEARYKLKKLTSLHWEPEEMPSPRQWKELDRLLQTHHARWMIWEAQPSKEIIAELHKRNVRIAVVSPCSNVPASGDFMQVMNNNANQLQAVFTKEKP